MPEKTKSVSCSKKTSPDLFKKKERKKIEEMEKNDVQLTRKTRKLKEESVRFWVRKSTNHARPPLVCNSKPKVIDAGNNKSFLYLFSITLEIALPLLAYYVTQ